MGADEIICAQLSEKIAKVFNFIELQTLAVKLDDPEWISLTKIFIKSLAGITEEESKSFLASIVLDSSEQVCMDCLTGAYS
jgi:hypothetical protein